MISLLPSLIVPLFILFLFLFSSSDHTTVRSNPGISNQKVVKAFTFTKSVGKVTARNRSFIITQTFKAEKYILELSGFLPTVFLQFFIISEGSEAPESESESESV